MELFLAAMQRELLDRGRWSTPTEASAIFEWSETSYNPIRHHVFYRVLSVTAFDARHRPQRSPQDHINQPVRRSGSDLKVRRPSSGAENVLT